MSDDQAVRELIASNKQGILAGVKLDGHPHLSNVLYLWDGEARTAKISTTADRVKGKIFKRDPKAALHVSGESFYQFAVAEGEIEMTETAAAPGDAACRELLRVHTALMGEQKDEEQFHADMIAAKRLILTLKVSRLYGMVMTDSPSYASED